MSADCSRLAACFGYLQDAWWYCTAEWKTVFISLLWVHITDHWKASRWQFYGSMWRFSANQGELGLFAHRSEWLWCQTEVLTVHIVCLTILGEICVAFGLGLRIYKHPYPQCVYVWIYSMYLYVMSVSSWCVCSCFIMNIQIYTSMLMYHVW